MRKRNFANMAVVLLASLITGCRTVEYRFLPVVILPPIQETVREQPALALPPQPVAEETDAQAAAALTASRFAAEQGNVPAQIETGTRLRDGRGSDPDVVEAFKWFQIAANHGDPQAGALMDELARQMSREQIREAQRRAKLYLKAP